MDTRAAGDIARPGAATPEERSPLKSQRGPTLPRNNFDEKSAVKAVLAGLGPYGYILAMQAALQAVGQLPESLPAPMRLGRR
jgi:hypothetical protein